MTVEQDGEIHVLCGFDDSYAMPAAAMMQSIAESHGDSPCAVHVVGIDLSAESRARLETLARPGLTLHWIELDPDLLGGLPGSTSGSLEYLSAAAYVPLVVDRLLPADVDRVIFLDVDTIVVDSLRELWKADLGPSVLGAVRDFGSPTLAAPFGVAPWRELGLDGLQPHFNSGVLVIDRRAWREHDVEARCRDYLGTHGDRVKTLDQEALNASLVGSWLELPPRWNYQAYLERPGEYDEAWIFSFVPRDEIESAGRSPAVIHYAGPWKPWRSGGPSPRAEEWFAAVDRTPWRGFRPDPATGVRWRVPRRIARRCSRAARVLVRGW